MSAALFAAACGQSETAPTPVETATAQLRLDAGISCPASPFPANGFNFLVDRIYTATLLPTRGDNRQPVFTMPLPFARNQYGSYIPTAQSGDLTLTLVSTGEAVTGTLRGSYFPELAANMVHVSGPRGSSPATLSGAFNGSRFEGIMSGYIGESVYGLSNSNGCSAGDHHWSLQLSERAVSR
jgi:hypothetical protein